MSYSIIMKNILIFAGTTEGRRLVEELQGYAVMLHVCVATEYGAKVLPTGDNICKHVGRLDEADMQSLIDLLTPVCLVDATHPYASIVTENLVRVCERTGCPYIRLARQKSTVDDENATRERCFGSKEAGMYVFDSVAAAADFLSTTEGIIFATTGSKELCAYTVIPDYKERVVARVLPTLEVMEACKALGFEGNHLIGMQGPFSEELNYQMLCHTKAKWLVTKCTGTAGGYMEKCEAAVRAGVWLCLIGAPKECENAVDFAQAVALACDYIGAEKPSVCKKTIAIVGAGPGDGELMTKALVQAVSRADVLIGARRVLEICDPSGAKKHLESYVAKDIMDYIDKDTVHSHYAAVYSGDVGFYSGAAQLMKCIKEAKKDYEITVIPGISSVIYLLDMLCLSWQTTVFCSVHGCDSNVTLKVRRNKVVATLLGDEGDVALICQRLCFCGLGDVKVVVGERLSYKEEKINTGTAKDFAHRSFDKLSVAIFLNDRPQGEVAPRDDDFIRGAVPMTKQEIRELSVSKLCLCNDAVIYDVGAGTGSVSVAMALQAEDGVVYAIEQKEEAQQLIARNASRFCCTNIQLVAGRAPEVLAKLPEPTHAFIGGSNGNLLEIIEAIRAKNKATRFVVNAVTVETLAKLSSLRNQYEEYADMELIYVQLSREKQMGGHYLMTADNGIYIASFGGNKELK